MGIRVWFTHDDTSTLKVDSGTMLDDPSRVCVRVFTSDKRDGFVWLQISRQQLAQLCQQVDTVWVDEFMAKEVSE